jgi:MFS family permease
MSNPQTAKDRPRNRLPTNVWALTIVSLLTDISTEMLVNLLPLFLFNVLGVQTAVIGLIEGVAETTASLVKLLSGSLSDRLGHRKPLTVLGYSLSAVAKPFLYIATSWVGVLIIRFTDRVGKGIRNAPRDALLAGSVKAGQRGLAFGLHRAGDTAGAFIGLAIAALIIYSSQFGEITLNRATFQKVVLASIIPAFLAVLILIIGVHEIEPPRQKKQKTAIIKLGWADLGHRFKAFLLVSILFTLGNSSDAFIILRGQERGLDLLQVMGMLLTFTATYTIFSSPAGALSDKVGRRLVILAGWTIYTLIYFGLAFAQGGYQIWVLFGLYGMYYALTEGAARAFVADLVPQAQRGTAYGLFYAAVGLTAFPASLIAGVLWGGLGAWSGLGPGAPFFFGAFMAFLAGILLWTWVR